MNDLKNSETLKNLMRAFAGESQARNRYTFSAGVAKKEKLPVIQEVFLFTADQEKEHADVFYNFMKDLAGDTVFIDGGYPIDISESTLDLLTAARHNEMEEYGTVYKEFGDIAKEEGFSLIGDTFHRIAEIEKTHAERFDLFAGLMEKNQLFEAETETSWMCLNCGYIYEGKTAPGVCPVCKHEQGYFIRLELAPYVK